jgi:hypothetical protein
MYLSRKTEGSDLRAQKEISQYRRLNSALDQQKMDACY